jgi:hypothetical protein
MKLHPKFNQDIGEAQMQWHLEPHDKNSSNTIASLSANIRMVPSPGSCTEPLVNYPSDSNCQIRPIVMVEALK